jgi:hypothetical protein
MTLASSACRHPPEAGWVNEKFPAVWFWRGRVIGTGLIVEVERERLACPELLRDCAYR